MPLTKVVLVDLVNVLQDGQLQVRTATQIWEDQVMLSESFHRHVVDLDHDDITDQEQLVQDVAEGVFTTARKVKRKIKKDKDKEDQESINNP